MTRNRARGFSIRAGEMLLDYSKTNIDAKCRDLLVGLAEAQGVAEKRDAMFAGEKINETEGRAVLHIAQRADDAAVIEVDGEDVMPELRETRARAYRFAEAVRSGEFAGQGGRSPMWSISGSAGRTLAPRWRRWRWRRSMTGHACIMCRTWTARISATRWNGWTPRRRW